MRRATHAFLFLLLIVALLVACPRSAAAEGDAYDDAFARAASAERRGDLAGAASALAAAVDAYPQDYAIALALGWTYFRAGRYADAEHAYRAAALRAPASHEARLGLAWSVAREGRCGEAQPSLRELLESPEADRAREGLAECEAPARAGGTRELAVAWNELLFPQHPYKASGTGFVASGASSIGDAWNVGGAYRFMRFAPQGTSALAPFSQHEGYLDVAYDRPAFAITARGAIVADGSGAYGTSAHAGASLRWSPFGDLTLDTALSAYPDLSVLRASLRWRIPIVGPLSLVPGLAVQRAGADTLPNASLGVAATFPRLSLWAGAKLGEEARPAYLDAHVVYDVPERVAWGAWLGARVKLTESVGLSAAYALDHLRRTDAVARAPAETEVHAISLGPFVEF
jgi:tetratricopeptide (TPR) repeat protein